MDLEVFTEEHLKKIAKYIKKIEDEHDIEIISAVDNGSRSMGIHTDASDFDIRFIFVHNKRVKHITGNYPDSFNVFFDNGMYDFDGWSIDKTVKHLKESNPSLIEWLYSPVVFVDKYNFISECLKVIKTMHNKLSMFYHYSSMAEKNYKDWIKNKDKVYYKKYVYVIRPLMMLMHLNTDCDNLIITKFKDLHNNVRSLLDDSINEDVESVIKLKQTMKGIEGEPFPRLNKWIENYLLEIDSIKEKKSTKKGDNMMGRSIISNYAKMCNEVRKIVAISNKNIGNKINRTNYLTVTFSVLEFLWVWNNQDKNFRDIPKNIDRLLDGIPKLPENIEKHIRFISKFKDTCGIDTTTLDNRKKIYDLLMPSIISFIKFIDNDYDLSQLDLNVRDDIYEYLINNVLTVLWMVNNPDKKFRDIPKDVLADKTSMTEYQHIKVMEILKGIKPVYMMDIIPELNDWYESIVNNYEKNVQEYSVKLQNIKEINVKERYKQTLKKVDEETFTKLVGDVLFP